MGTVAQLSQNKLPQEGTEVVIFKKGDTIPTESGFYAVRESVCVQVRFLENGAGEEYLAEVVVNGKCEAYAKAPCKEDAARAAALLHLKSEEKPFRSR